MVGDTLGYCCAEHSLRPCGGSPYREPIVQAIGRQPQRAPDGAPLHYERHRPEQTALYCLVQEHAVSFIAHTKASIGAELPRTIKDE